MPWQFHAAEKGLVEHAANWDTANRRNFQSHPLLDTRFVLPLVRSFGSQDTKLAVLVGHDESVDSAILIRRRARGVWSTFLPSQAQIAPVVIPPARTRALNGLIREVPSTCWLLEMMAQDREYSCFREHIPEIAEEIFYARTIRVDLSSDFETYWQSRPKSLRRHLRRYLNAIKELEFQMALRIEESPPSISAALERYGDLEVRGWKGASGTAIHAGNEQGKFYASVLSNFADMGRAYVYELYFGDRLAASRLCIASEKMLVILKTTYDEDLSQYAPGRVLLYLLLESEFRLRRHRVVEFYTNADKATLAWGTDSRVISHVNVFRGAMARSALVAARRAKYVLESTAAAINSVVPTENVQNSEVDRGPEDEFLVDVISDYTDFKGLQESWQRIYELDGYRSVFLSHQWFDNFIEEILECRDLSIHVVRRKQDGSTEAIFPMMLSHGRFSKILSPDLQFVSNFYSPVAKPIYGTRRRPQRVALARAFVRSLRATRTPWSSVDFNLLPRETQDFEILVEALRSEGLRYTTYFASANWIAPVVGVSYEDYSSSLPSKLKNTARRRLRRAKRAGDVRFEILTDSTGILERMDDYYAVYARSWKRPEPYPSFHRSLVDRLVADGGVALGLAYFDGSPVAAQIWLFHDGVASILKLCYDQRQAEFSFGTILTQRLMEFAIEEKGVTVVDFLNGDEVYKRDWMSVRRERWGIVAFNERLLQGRIAAFREVALKPKLKMLMGRSRDRTQTGPPA